MVEWANRISFIDVFEIQRLQMSQVSVAGVFALLAKQKMQAAVVEVSAFGPMPV